MKLLKNFLLLAICGVSLVRSAPALAKFAEEAAKGSAQAITEASLAETTAGVDNLTRQLAQLPSINPGFKLKFTDAKTRETVDTLDHAHPSIPRHSQIEQRKAANDLLWERPRPGTRARETIDESVFPSGYKRRF